MIIKFNLNDYIWVKLTKSGREIIRQHHKRIFAGSEKENFYIPKENPEGWSKWQAWEIINLLGHTMCMGGRQGFDLNILIDAGEDICSEKDFEEVS